MPEAVGLGNLLHLRAGVCNRYKLLSSIRFTHSILHAIKEVLLEDIGFQRAAGFTGDNE